MRFMASPKKGDAKSREKQPDRYGNQWRKEPDRVKIKKIN